MNVPALVAAYEALGQRLFAQLGEKPGNLVLSPFSIGNAMAMALVGARGVTETEMASVLGQPPRGEIAMASAALIKSLTGFGLPDASHLAIANAVMLDETRGGGLLPSYLTLVRDCFAAEIMAGATPAQVNAWVHRKTMGRVPSLLDEVDERSVAVLLNALAFSAGWAAPFKADNTRPAPFRLADGTLVQTPMLRGTVHATVASGDGYDAIRIPFERGRFGLVIVVSAAADPGRPGATLPAKNMLFELAKSRSVALQLPRFRVVSTFDMVPPLRHLGLRDAFEDTANFRGMTDAEPGVKIDQVRHAACIEIDEAGCTAAAATVAAVAASAIEAAKPTPFVVDRPFNYFLVDDMTGATIMRGRITDPRD